MQKLKDMEMKKVLILDYKLGNLFSVQQACNNVGLNASISSDKAEIGNADAIILPGVGAFIEAMSNMEKLDLISPLKDYVSMGKPLFGICLGLQLLFSESEEFGAKNGLDFIPGVIKKFPAKGDSGEKIKVPQIGWNQIASKDTSWSDTPLATIPENAFMYFVHSYYVQPVNNGNILSITNYDEVIYSSSVVSNNIFATQFHPEKSAELGISIYKNWAKQNNLI